MYNLSSYKSTEVDNNYFERSDLATSPLSDAKTLLEEGGSLATVSLLLEAAIQRGELGTGRYEAWILLGEARSMEERVEAGVRALTEGVKRAEATGATGQGMLVTTFATFLIMGNTDDIW